MYRSRVFAPSMNDCAMATATKGDVEYKKKEKKKLAGCC